MKFAIKDFFSKFTEEILDGKLHFCALHEEHDFANKHEKSRKNQTISEWCKCGKCGVMDTNVECLNCHKVEDLKYF